LKTGISWWKLRRRGQWKYVLFCWQCSSSLPLREPVDFILSYLTNMVNDLRMPAYRWVPPLVCIVWTMVILTTFAIYGDGKVGGTCFAPKVEDTEHDDVPSRCSGVGEQRTSERHHRFQLPSQHKHPTSRHSLRTPHIHLHYELRSCIPLRTNRPQTWPKREQQSRRRRRAHGPPSSR
jgi:hypothetical protein